MTPEETRYLAGQIMTIITRDRPDDPVTVREVYDILKTYNYTDVMTTMVQLSNKGLLKIVGKQGLANLYAHEGIK